MTTYNAEATKGFSNLYSLNKGKPELFYMTMIPKEVEIWNRVELTLEGSKQHTTTSPQTSTLYGQFLCLSISVSLSVPSRPFHELWKSIWKPQKSFSRVVTLITLWFWIVSHHVRAILQRLFQPIYVILAVLFIWTLFIIGLNTALWFGVQSSTYSTYRTTVEINNSFVHGEFKVSRFLVGQSCLPHTWCFHIASLKF